MDRGGAAVSLGVALALALAGALGTLARYGVAMAMGPGGRLPWPTLVVNVLGAAAIGLVVAVCAARDAGRLRLVLATGFLGGFTTFSSLALESVQLLERRAWGPAAVYVGVTLVAGVAACAAGLWLGHALARS
ncbi:MAG: CrcB family protein [Kofleriaceae bacterium]